MATFVILRHPVNILVLDANHPNNLTNEIFIPKSFKNLPIVCLLYVYGEFMKKVSSWAA